MYVIYLIYLLQVPASDSARSNSYNPSHLAYGPIVCISSSVKSWIEGSREVWSGANLPRILIVRPMPDQGNLKRSMRSIERL